MSETDEIDSGVLSFRYSTCEAHHLHLHVEKVPDPILSPNGKGQTIDLALTPEQVVEHMAALVQFLAFVGMGVIEFGDDFPLDQFPGFEDGEEEPNG